MGLSTINRTGGPLLLVCAFLAGFAAWIGSALTPWCSVVDTALVGWNVSSIHTRTHKLCHVACLESANCSSANYWWQSKVCELNILSHLSVSESHMVKASGSIYTFTQMTGCNLASVLSRHGNDHEALRFGSTKDSEWRLVFKGVAGTGAKLYDMWTSESWDPSVEISGSCRDNDLHRAWRNGQLHVRQVKLSLHNSTGVAVKLVFNGTGSDIKNWFNKPHLIESPWADLTTALFEGGYGQIFSLEGGTGLERRFHINIYYQICESDAGWLVVTDSQSQAGPCEWEKPSPAHPNPKILYSTTSSTVKWHNLLSDDGTVGRADSMTIHIDIE
ncbi:uncharacterized protein LOC110974695 [Acanthaster planci]|uniref:Uncharacterized protein LOC110974695 n=1 Tax=Acanthaster planci TaxID=133434 RepID=A0A8B7XQ60_ACAPL|nr:uncharacterized protein LOC110974695 [Acanthaster planci]